MTNKQVYKDMTKFWGKLFGINFALGVATGLTMEFQFGTNWAYYSHYVGDIFGAPLAIEGLVAFFLESTFVGLFFFGWDRLSKRQHLGVTWLVAIGSNFSALWILIANAWMQHPVGAHFNYETMRMEMVNFSEIIFNPVAQVKFVHTVAAGYTTGAMFVLAISSFYILKGRDLPFARRSFAIASSFGMAAILSVIVLGDSSGYEVGEVQKIKLSAIEAMWETEPAPASFTLFGLPSQKTHTTEYAVKIPYLMGIIGTHSLDKQIPGLVELREQNLSKIRNGMVAYGLLKKLRDGDKSEAVVKQFDKVKGDLGYGLLLKRYTPEVTNATEAQIQKAASDTIPEVWPIFWSFRIMVACGFIMLGVFGAAFYQSCRQRIGQNKWVHRIALYSLPLPWIAVETGWYVAEGGRQPWAVGGILPTHVAASPLSATDIWTSLAAIVVFYSALLVAEVYLMLKFARIGPSSLKTGRYHHENNDDNTIEDKVNRQVEA